MKWKTTLVLLVITGAVFAYMYFYERTAPDTQQAAREREKVVNFDRDKINGIVIQNGNDRIELRRHDDKWRLEKPIKDQANNSAVESLLLDLESWQKDATIPAKELEADKNKLGEYGLNRAKLRLKLIGPGAPAEILFGKDAALEGKEYVRFADSKEAFIAGQSVKKDIEKKPEDFRDRKLTDLIEAQVARVVLQSPAGEMELQKQDEHWEITKPLRARADDQKVGDLIAQVTTAQIQKFVGDDRGDLHPYGLAEPRGSITLFAQGDKQGQTLQIGGPAGAGEKEKDEVYVRFSARGSVYTLPKKIEDLLNTKPNDLRDRHLVRIDVKNLDRITIDAAGKGKTVLARKGEDWTIANEKNIPANASEVRRLIDTLQSTQVTRFVEDVASNLPKYGLDKPQLQLTFSSFASQNTAESNAGERPFATVAFGKVDGNDVYARVGEEPFVVAVNRGLLDQIFTDPLQWQDLAIFKFKPEQIHRLSVEMLPGKAVELVRGVNKQWTVANGKEEVNQANVQSLLNTLSSLHAVRWAGATIAEQGLGKPRLTASFTTSPDDKAVHKLTVGDSAPQGMWFAKVDGREGTFVMNNPDFTALKLPLVKEATPLPSPSPAASPSTSPSASPASSPSPAGKAKR
jgi:Domain of unknown function (DUF4340)